MKAHVITIMDNPKSIKVAGRCINSEPKLKIKYHEAFTPKDNLNEIFKRNDIKDLSRFHANEWGRPDRQMAAFLSHLYVWKQCLIDNENTLVLEHDAIITGDIPENLSFNKVITLGKPSYGQYNTPKFLGVGPMVQASYTKGAHGYVVSPAGAKALLDKAKTHAETTDIFLNLGNFPWLQEYYPWAVEVRDTFTTIQNSKGCRAKDLSHMLKPTEYEII